MLNPWELDASEAAALHKLWGDEDVQLYRGQLRGDAPGTSTLFLTTSSAHPFPAAHDRFRNYFDLRGELDPRWAACPSDLIQRGNQPVLVLSDPGSSLLAARMGQAMDVPDFLRAAISITVALERVHAAGIIHKDIKPSNILIDYDRMEARLLGFGIASRLRRERHTPGPPEVIAGSFPYMAGEQTGRMNRSVDMRTDLYSLGVTFYQMLTGELPFKASNAMEWIHCQVARQPQPPAERLPGIPKVLSAIALKLMSKSADDRYQTAGGLLFDLRKCLEGEIGEGSLEVFPLGSQDTTGQLRFREKLYGRETEISALKSALANVIALRLPEVVLVAGYSGIGKSSVVNELHRELVPPRGVFVSGKFDQYQKGIPYSSLAQASQALVRQLLGKNETEITRWREEFEEAIGSNGQLILNLVPELELITGPQPRVQDLSGPESQSRFNRVFKAFLGLFAKAEQPLVLFLDDLQWLDLGTLEIFEYLATQPDLSHVLLIGAFRHNEVGPEHPLSPRLTKIREANPALTQINLEGLEASALSEMIADAMQAAQADIEPLVRMVLHKTGGSPFVTTQLVSALADEKLLRFQSDAGTWAWDSERIKTKQVGGNVVDLVIERLGRLQPQSLAVLADVACLGSNIDVGLLGRISGLSKHQLDTLLDGALELDLLYRVDDAYVFAHDRVQEAVYAMLSEDERRDKHTHLASRMFEVLDTPELDGQLFELAGHLRKGGPREEIGSERAAAEVFLRASRKARASAAFGEATAFASEARMRLGDRSWSSDYQFSFDAALQHAECSFLGGQMEAADQIMSEMLPLARTRAHKAAIYRLRLELLVVQSANEEAVECLIEAMQIFGEDLRAHPTWDQVKEEYDRFHEKLNGRELSALLDLDEMNDPDLLGLMSLLAEALSPAFYTDYNLMVFLTIRMGRLNLEHGKSILLGYTWLGCVYGHAFGRWEEGYRFGKQTLDSVVTEPFTLLTARVYHMTGMLSAWTQPLPLSVDLYRTAYSLGVPAGDHYFSCYASAHIVLTALQAGTNLQSIHEEAKEFLAFAKSIGFSDGAGLILSTERVTAALQGLTKGLSDFSDESFDEAEFTEGLKGSRMSTVVYWHWTRKLMAHFLAGENELAVEASRKGDPGPWIYKVMQVQNLDYQYFSALAIAACLPKAQPCDQPELRRCLMAHHSQIKSWAEGTGNATFSDKLALTEAEIARIEGREKDAERLYEQAIQAANECGFIQNEALAYELAARFHRERGFERTAMMFLREARTRYQSWGAFAKVRQLDDLYPGLGQEGLTAVPPADRNRRRRRFQAGSPAADPRLQGEHKPRLRMHRFGH